MNTTTTFPLDNLEAASAAFGAFLLVFCFISLVCFAFWVWGLVQTCKWTDEEYVSVGSSKTMWILLQVFFGVLGTFAWAIIARPKLP